MDSSLSRETDWDLVETCYLLCENNIHWEWNLVVPSQVLQKVFLLAVTASAVATRRLLGGARGESFLLEKMTKKTRGDFGNQKKWLVVFVWLFTCLTSSSFSSVPKRVGDHQSSIDQRSLNIQEMKKKLQKRGIISWNLTGAASVIKWKVIERIIRWILRCCAWK